ncbi:MAG: hypothetical protein IPP17_19415 [Bacteroidetes bacterium]|nr:hypothetical protein [Bacteroidota bacterium]
MTSAITLKSSDPSYADVADERYYLYLQQCPTTERASFRAGSLVTATDQVLDEHARA